jgi:hypothetical protein
MDSKTCRKCGKTKSLADFYPHPGCRDGVRPECKACNLAAKVARHRAEPQPARDRTQRWRQDNPDRYAENQRRFRESGGKKLADRRSHLKRKYGITLEQYDDLLERQGGVCGICGAEPHPTISLHVDHDHETGALRGLLCFRCNQAIGSLQEDASLLLAAADYLDRHDQQRDEIRTRIEERLAELPPPAWKQPV